MALSSTIHTEGLGRLRRDLRRIDVGMAKGLTTELRAIGKEAQAKVHGSTATPHRTGKLRKSVKVSVQARGVSLYSTLPQAPVWNWGGEISPRGTPIRIPRTKFVSGPVAEASEGTEDRLAALFDSLARAGIIGL